MQNREANRMRAKFRYQPHVLVDVPSVLEFVSVLRPTKSRTRVEKKLPEAAGWLSHTGLFEEHRLTKHPQ